MFSLQYTGITSEELATIQSQLEGIKRLEDQEYREIPEHVDSISGETVPARQEALPRAIRIQTTSVESNPAGVVKITLQGEKADEEGALLLTRLSALEAKRVG